MIKQTDYIYQNLIDIIRELRADSAALEKLYRYAIKLKRGY
jgi:hypothetical protein